MSGLFNLNWKDILSALVSTVVVAVLAYLATLTSIVDVDFKHVLDIGFFAGVGSLLKAFTTDNSGKLLGAWKIK